MKVEEEFLDVLQNIESMIIKVYRERDKSFSDHSVSRAFEAAIDEMVAIKIKREPRDFNLNEAEEDILKGILSICHFRLGRVKLTDENNEVVGIKFEPNTPQELIDCLKKLQNSLKFWNKEFGRHGYLNNISKFV